MFYLPACDGPAPKFMNSLNKLPASNTTVQAAHTRLPHTGQHNLPHRFYKSGRISVTFISSLVSKPFLGTSGGKAGFGGRAGSTCDDGYSSVLCNKTWMSDSDLQLGRPKGWPANPTAHGHWGTFIEQASDPLWLRRLPSLSWVQNLSKYDSSQSMASNALNFPNMPTFPVLEKLLTFFPTFNVYQQRGDEHLSI